MIGDIGSSRPRSSSRFLTILSHSFWSSALKTYSRFSQTMANWRGCGGRKVSERVRHICMHSCVCVCVCVRARARACVVCCVWCVVRACACVCCVREGEEVGARGGDPHTSASSSALIASVLQNGTLVTVPVGVPSSSVGWYEMPSASAKKWRGCHQTMVPRKGMRIPPSCQCEKGG